MQCELLVNARAAEIFSLYQDPYHWNLLFSGISQAYLDKSLAPGARGAVELALAGRWRMRVLGVYDDHELIICLRRWILRLTFRVSITPVNTDLCRVNHSLRAGLFATPLLWLLHNSIHAWLNLNLYAVQERAHKMREEREALASIARPRRKGKTRGRAKSRAKQ